MKKSIRTTVTTICDRCNRESTASHYNFFRSKVVLSLSGDSFGLSESYNNVFDLCDKCQDDLFEFLKNVQVNPRNKWLEE